MHFKILNAPGSSKVNLSAPTPGSSTNLGARRPVYLWMECEEDTTKDALKTSIFQVENWALQHYLHNEKFEKGRTLSSMISLTFAGVKLIVKILTFKGFTLNPEYAQPSLFCCFTISFMVSIAQTPSTRCSRQHHWTCLPVTSMCHTGTLLKVVWK